MCGICGSNNISKFKELVKQNLSRGSFSHSFTVIDMDTGTVIQQIKSFYYEDLNEDLDKLSVGGNCYYIGHTQAPTGGLIQDFNKIHPHISTNIEYPSRYDMLWHNGIILKVPENYEWDTAYLHLDLPYNYYDVLDRIEGSFACCHYTTNGKIRIFRNANAPLYFNGHDFSSNEFENSQILPWGQVFELVDNEFIKTKFEFDCKNIYTSC